MSEHTTLLPSKNVWESTAPRRRSDERSLRRDVWTILRYRASIRHRTRLQRASYVFEAFILVLILVNVVLAMCESAFISKSPSDPHTRSDWYTLFLYISTFIFSIEYLLRFWSCVEDERFYTPIIGRITWMLRPMSIIDLIVLIPFYVEIASENQHAFTSSRGILAMRGVRLLRVMSFLRLERSYNAMKNLRAIYSSKTEELWIVSYLTGVVVITASTAIFFLENPTQPNVFTNPFVCAWWAIQTITSLGYGDIVPVTAGGRVFSSILALWGIILFTIPGAILSSGFVEVMLQKEQESKKAFNEELRRTFSRELLAVSSHGFRHGKLDSFGTGIFSTDETKTTPEVEQLQNQVSMLLKMQEQTQNQLRMQQLQLDAMHKLLERALLVTPTQEPEKPPFSEIVLASP
ncbi:hypothetical protein Poli38472_005582 [Pythium oligandrum]|uniref:Ion transport domain-containing protein n=1 Tax=Pythium oligandrum TaxID=41045 RepID=A0A8K1CG90_PYTOL|nr:hypothetical protein Poli38472_005582 [Pythium oligandrum]|eukprot:TMW62964.1 hypothetical protein Poli38472_005582 [Pythium oligandrum]